MRTSLLKIRFIDFVSAETFNHELGIQTALCPLNITFTNGFTNSPFEWILVCKFRLEKIGVTKLTQAKDC